jgi:hypothetical protein
MRPSRSLFAAKLLNGVVLAVLFPIASLNAQQSQPSLQVSTPLAVVPRLIQFNNVLKDSQNKPLSGILPVTFAIYARQDDNRPLWMEMQDVTVGADGSYTVLLGSASQGGVPAELFSKGEARWLGIQTPEQAERPRVLLVSVPYALKAADADTLGGLPASAFLTAAGTPTSPAAQASTVLVESQITNAAATTGTGTTNFIPLWTSSTNLGNSILFQSSGNVQVNGGLQLPQLGTATATAAFNSRPIDLFASVFNSSVSTPIVQHFRWQAEAVGNNTSAASSRVSLLYASGTGTPAETGLSISSKGILTFASGQTLPAVSGNETVSGNMSAKQLISTVASGTAPLTVTSTTQVSNLNASLLGGLSASAFQRAGSYAGLGANIFASSQTIKGNLSLTGTINNTLLLQGTVTHGSNTSANVIAGFGNSVSAGATGATIGGGGARSNGGGPNMVSDDFGTVGGGDGNVAGNGDGTAGYATVSGGNNNVANGLASTISGGGLNVASGNFSTAAGGLQNVASGYASFAAGQLANAEADGDFVWCQQGGIACHPGPTANTFFVAVTGPIVMLDGLNGQGCSLNPGTAGWQCSSDRNLKNNIRPVEPRSVLERVATMPITQWSMKADTGGHNHIGPMAQDFYAAFGLGDSDKYIAQGDAQGVALASIKGLYQLLQEKDEESRRLQKRLAALEERLSRFEAAAQNAPR